MGQVVSFNETSELVENLRKLSSQLRGHSNATKFSDQWNYQGPAINKDDLAALADAIADKAEVLQWTNHDSERAEALKLWAAKVENAATQIAPNLFSAVTAYQGIVLLLYMLEVQLGQWVSETSFKGSIALPLDFAKQVNLGKKRLEQAVAGIDNLDEKVTRILSAYDAATNLPATQHDLEEAIAELAKARKTAQEHEFAAKTSASAAQLDEKKMQNVLQEADTIVAKLKDAYRAAMSQGLAHAFSAKEKALNQSMLIWILGLLASLVVAGSIAHERFPKVLALVTGQPDWGVVLINLVLGALSLAPPIWFAWVSTKQIGQRFRLAEDYAYKAALAAAYEGYRSEAARLDEALEAQLFAIALGRLDEIPLRLVEPDVPGSPLHELLRSDEFKAAKEQIPGLKEKLVAIFKRSKKTSKDEVEVADA